GAEVHIRHAGRHATTLRGQHAAAFLADVEGADLALAQQVMARITGNYKHGNERTAQNHPRNRGR
ncbi:MAG TPA: hypothetical protein VMM13_08375, partial [Euzebya sp.]|nr:hypothetical protein [Euzebya sp.]